MRIQSNGQIKNSFGEMMDVIIMKQPLIESSRHEKLEDVNSDISGKMLYCNDCERWNHLDSEQFTCQFCGGHNLD